MTKARDLAGFASSAVTTTASDGLVLKGDGSTTDVIIKNGANATVAKIADGSTDLSKVLARGAIDVGNSSGVSVPLAIGTNGYFLKSNGSDAAWGEVVGSDSRQNYVADGNITARQAVFLKSDGKASATQSLKMFSKANVGSTGRSTGNNPNDGYSKSANAYSTVDNVHVTIYLKGNYIANTNTAVCVVSQINADLTITSGSDNANAFGSSTYRNVTDVQMQYSSTINKFIILYTYMTSSSNHYLRMAVGTLSGNAGAANKTFTISNQVSVGSENSGYRIGGGSFNSKGNYGGSLPGAGGEMFFAPDGSNIKGFLFSPYCNSGSGDLGAYVVPFTVAANGSLSVGSFTAVTGGNENAGTIASLNGYAYSAHYHIPTNQWVLVTTRSSAGYIWMFTQGSGSTTMSQITNDDKINFGTSGLALQNANTGFLTMQTIDNTHFYLCVSTGSYKNIYRFTIGSTAISGGTGDDATSITEKNPSTGNVPASYPSNEGWQYKSGFKAYRESGLGFYSGWSYQPDADAGSSSTKQVIFSEFIYTGNNGALGYLEQSQYLDSVSVTGSSGIMANGFGSYDDERNAFFMFGWAGSASSTVFVNNPLIKGVFKADLIGSGTTPIGIHDSGSTASNGATASIGMFGSLIEGFSSLTVGSQVVASNNKSVGYAISATKVMVTQTNG